jgi:hypothetical protein
MAKPKTTKPSKPGLYDPKGARPLPAIKDTPVEKIKVPKGS